MDISRCFLSTHHLVPFHGVDFERVLHLQIRHIVRLVYMQFQISPITPKCISAIWGLISKTANKTYKTNVTLCNIELKISTYLKRQACEHKFFHYTRM